MIDRLVKLVPCNNLDNLVDIVDTICILCTDVAENRTLAGKAGTIAILVEIIRQHQTSESVIRAACQAITELCLENSKNKKKYLFFYDNKNINK